MLLAVKKYTIHSDIFLSPKILSIEILISKLLILKDNLAWMGSY